jgi:uncharacterized protein YdeI (YjbR/CyaY-like superfamily)
MEECRHHFAQRASLGLPADLKQALAANAKAAATFRNFAPSPRRGYLDWLADAKQSATRERRLRTTIEELAEGKPQNWKYLEQCARK